MAKVFVSVLSFALLLSLSFAIEGQGGCQITRINAQNPSYTLKAQGGVSDYWDHNSDDFQCAGVSFHRHRLQPRALMLPAYHNAPVLFYVVKGQGIFGLLNSGCPETFESSQQFGEGSKQQRFVEKHQKIEQFRQGDIVAIPAGVAHWAYNNGDQELVVVALLDNTNNANQLDQNPRSFFLAGNPGARGQGQGQQQMHNVLDGLSVEILAEVFGIKEETARKLQSENDNRGHILLVQGDLQVVTPYSRRQEEEEEYRSPRDNGLEETICTAKIRENIDNPSRADIYNPGAGRFSTVNSLTLPILRFIQLSAARGVLYRNAIMSPHWYVNAHTILYVTRGESRVQIVNHKGQAVFDGQVREGQALVVPQYYAAVKKAGEQGFEWVEFNTNDNAMINTLSGRTSALRGLPVDVIANAYQIPREEAEKVKFSRRETLFFKGSYGRHAYA